MKTFLSLIIGFGLVGLGVKSAYTNLHLMLFGAHTYGYVVSYDVLHSSGSKKYGAKAKFEVDGKLFVTTSENYSKKRKYRTKDLVEVVYLPNAPENAKIASDVKVGAMTYLPAGVGILSLLFGFGLATGRIEQVD